ncbi:MAG: ComEC family competence protein [Chlorobi bacterium]|nr:ComEC family competence protein [Chlorobiota bacterium]
MNFSPEIHKVPFIRLLIPFLFGIIFQIYFPLKLYYPAIVLVSAIIIAILAYTVTFYKKKINLFLINDILTFFLLFTFGLFLVSHSNSKLEKLQQYDLTSGTIIADITESPVIKEKSVKTILNVTAIKSQDKWIATSGKVIAYLEKDSLSEKLVYGNRLIMDASFDSIDNPKNPQEFNYKKYMAFHLISRQTYLKSGHWKLIGKNHGNKLKVLAESYRKKLINIYLKNGIKNKEFAVLSALTLGYKDKLDAETKKSYSASGAMHLLAVSGLHIGILYLLLSSLLKFMPKTKSWKIIKVIILLSSLWFYALITGLPPSAFRSSLMFSLIIIGNSLKRYPSIYNTIAASAFILLTINPFIVTEVGFQLSYFAVIAIVFFQPKISRIFHFKHKIPKKLWDIVAVSIAAQIGTAPVALFYFHQFPVYFLLTNFIVLPVAFILIFASIGLFIFSFITPVAHFIALFIIYLLKFLNSSVHIIENLPFSIIPNISFTFLQVIVLYIAILLLSAFIVTKNKKLISYTLLSFITFFIISDIRYYKTISQRYFIVYNINNVSAYNFINGKDNLLISDIEKQDKNLDFHVKNNWIYLGTNQEQIINLKYLENPKWIAKELKILLSQNIFYKKGFLQFYNKRIVLYNQANFNRYFTQKLKTDYIVLSKNSHPDLHYISSNLVFNKLIFDSSFSRKQLNSLISDCKKLNIPYYSVKNNGAFQISIND